jgi:hypothetical protein
MCYHLDHDDNEHFQRLVHQHADIAHLFYLFDPLLRCVPHCSLAENVPTPSDSGINSPATESEQLHQSPGQLIISCLDRIGRALGFPVVGKAS